MLSGGPVSVQYLLGVPRERGEVVRVSTTELVVRVSTTELAGVKTTPKMDH